MRARGRVVSLGLILALGTGSSSLAQSRYDVTQVQKQIDRSGRLQQEALANLNDPARAEELVQQAQRELRAAQSAMIINASGMKYADPLLDLNSRKADQALMLLQRVRDALSSNRGSPVRGPYLDQVRSNLETSVRLTRLVLAL
jgi:hypothetical protein